MWYTQKMDYAPIKKVYPIQWTMFICRKEYGTHICYNTDEPWKHVKWKKLIQKTVVYVSTNVNGSPT